MLSKLLRCFQENLLSESLPFEPIFLSFYQPQLRQFLKVFHYIYFRLFKETLNGQSVEKDPSRPLSPIISEAPVLRFSLVYSRGEGWQWWLVTTHPLKWLKKSFCIEHFLIWFKFECLHKNIWCTYWNVWLSVKIITYYELS